jgi:hypothetical protein
VPHAEVVGLAPRWLPRHPPLPPVAVAGQGAAARALAAAALPQAAALSLHLDPQADLLVLHLLPGAPAAALPWADGALFLGVDPAAPAMLLRTAAMGPAPGCGAPESLAISACTLQTASGARANARVWLDACCTDSSWRTPLDATRCASAASVTA